MKLSAIGHEVLEALTHGAAQEEAHALDLLLERLPIGQRLDIDAAVGAYVAAMREAGFLAGLRATREPLGYLVEED